jgi:YggT family protein
MNALNEITIYLLQTALTLLLFAALLRFLLQAVRADFYNPICQFLVKVTNPMILPLRRLIPAFGGIDTASLVLLLLVQIAGLVAMLALLGAGWPNPLLIVLWAVIAIAALLVQFYFFALLAMIIVSWVAPGSRHPLVALLYQITEPVMAPVRRIIPPLGGLDFSPIAVFIMINILQIVLRNVAYSVGLHPALVIGL